MYMADNRLSRHGGGNKIMSRNFFGGFGGGGGNRGLFGGGPRKGAASQVMMEKITGKTQKSVEKKDLYKEMLKSKVESYKKQQVDQGVIKGGYQKSGGMEQEGQLSGAAMRMIEMMGQRKAKKREKEGQRIKINPMNVQGGRISMTGVIYTNGGRKVGQIDTKTGQICNNFGMSLGQGKFDPKSLTSLREIERMIDNFRKSNRRPEQNRDAPIGGYSPNSEPTPWYWKWDYGKGDH